MAKFRCLLSGNIVEFTQKVDIDSMVGHDGYERLLEPGEEPVQITEHVHALPLTKPRGRPPAKAKK